MSTAKKVVSNSFYLFLMWGFSTLFGYLFWVVLANFLPKADVGMFSAALNLALFAIGFTFLGLHTAETKLIPAYDAKKEAKKIGGTIRYVTKNVLLANAIVAATAFIFAGQISAFYLNEIAIRAFAMLLVVISATTIIAHHLYAMQKMKTYFLTETASSLVKLVAVFILVILGFGWLGAAAGLALAFIAISLFRLKWIPFSGSADKKEIWHYAVPAFIAGLGTMLLNQGSIVFLSFLANAASVGAFTIAFMFTTPIKIIPQVITQAISPATSEEFAAKQHARLKNLVAQSMRYSYFVSIPLAITFVLFAREFLAVFARNYVSEAMAFQILAAAYLFFGMGSIMTNVLYFAGKPNLNRDITLFSGFANIALLFVLVPLFGINGAAAAFLAAGGIMFFAGLRFARKHIRMPLGVRANILKIGGSSALFAAVLTLFKIFGFSGSAKAPWFLAALFFASSAYLLSLLFMGFFSDVDLRILKNVEAKMPKRLKFMIIYAERILERFAK